MRRFSRISMIFQLLSSGANAAGDWQVLDGAGVRQALEGRALDYAN